MFDTLEPLDPRIPQWDIHHSRPRDCPFCESKNKVFFKRPDNLPVSFCENCETWYINQIPSTSEINSFYNGYYYSHRPMELTQKAVDKMIKKASKTALVNWHLQAILRLHSGPDPIRILEVGCGIGQFLLEAKSLGADVIGCDLSPEACDFVNNNLGITVFQSELHLCASAIGQVDAIVMRDFIEHPVKPMIDIKAAIGILKPRGSLLFHTPNGGEAGTTLMTAHKWVGFRVDLEHLQYLSPYTVNWLSRKFNMRIERLEVSGFPRLDGFKSLPQIKPNSIDDNLKRTINSIFALKIFSPFRRIKNIILKNNPNPRLGSYHLCTILRKT